MNIKKRTEKLEMLFDDTPLSSDRAIKIRSLFRDAIKHYIPEDFDIKAVGLLVDNYSDRFLDALGEEDLVRPEVKEQLSTRMAEAVKKTTDLRNEVTKKFLDPNEPPFFPGCEELRKEYYEGVSKAGGESCPNCVRNRLLLQAITKAMNIIAKQNSTNK